MTEMSKRAQKRARGQLRAGKRSLVDACICQTVTLVASPSGLTYRPVKSPLRTIRARCRHWQITDEWTGQLTDALVTPKIGGQRRNGVSRASHKSMSSPWNKLGPLS